MEGLAISILRVSELENWLTIGSEYYSPEIISLQTDLRNAQGSIKTLREISVIITDGDHGSADYRETGVPFIMSEAVREGWIDIGQARYISEEHHRKNLRSSLGPGDVLVTKTGVYFGNSAVVPENLGPANTIAHVGRIVLKEGYNPYFVSTFLNSKYGYAQLRRRGIKATRPEIKLIEFHDIEIFVASKAFQGRIEDEVQRSHALREQVFKSVRRAEQLLLDALGLADWMPPEALSYTRAASEVFAAGRLDAQYFMPAKQHVQKALSVMPGLPLGQRFHSIRDLFDPKSASADAIVRNYDVTDALTPVLDDEKQPSKPEDILSVKKWFRNGDVAISRLRAYLRQIAVVRASSDIPAVGSSEFIVLRAVESSAASIAPETLMTFLRSAPVQTVLKWCQDGSQHPRFSERDLLSIHVPDAVAMASPQIEAIVQESFAARRRARDLLGRARRALEIAIEESEDRAIRFLDEARP